MENKTIEIDTEIKKTIEKLRELKAEKENNKNSNFPPEQTEFLFPYPTLRNIQKELMSEIIKSLNTKTHLIVHAPTGLGKTAATLAPALKYAIDNKKTVFFLTSRHTQHLIAIETLKKIREKFQIDFVAIDLIGKKWMCPVPGTDKLYSNEFAEYCKKQREENKCEYYLNTKDGFKLTTEAKLALKQLKNESPCHIERFSELCGNDKLCSYELAVTLSKEAKVIVADYYYIFNQTISELFFQKSQLSLSNSIVIVDEGHNLPERIRKLLTVSISNAGIKRAIKEAKKTGQEDLTKKLFKIHDVIIESSQSMRNGEEKEISKEKFIEAVKKIDDYEELIFSLDFAANIVRETEKQSAIGNIAIFLEAWKGQDDGYARILHQKESRTESLITLSYKCLDPSLISKETIQKTHATIIMSGTLTPTNMYKELLGFPSDTPEKKYSSPFPEKNKLSIIVPETTTKFSMRNPDQFKRIAEICADISNRIPGNSAIFFPSYYLRNEIYKFFCDISTKTAFLEDSEMTKEEKTEFLNKFKKYKQTGAVLLGTVSGSYGEGVDLPGDLLKCVIVVGLPLQQPTLETKKLIEYYDKRFSKGWDYGYVAPAFTKCLQSAGRCIRSETDRGVIVFIDERYQWNNYFKYFPADWNIKVTKVYRELIEKFFD